jgi:hypothetical protein
LLRLALTAHAARSSYRYGDPNARMIFGSSIPHFKPARSPAFLAKMRHPMGLPKNPHAADAGFPTASEPAFAEPPSREFLMQVRILEMANKRRQLQRVASRYRVRDTLAPALTPPRVACSAPRSPLPYFSRYALSLLGLATRLMTRRRRLAPSLEKPASAR